METVRDPKRQYVGKEDKFKREQINKYRTTKWLLTEFILASHLVHHTNCSMGALPITMVITTQVIHYT